MKKIITGIVALCLMAVVAMTAFAGTVPFMDDAAFRGYVADGVRVFDTADLLTPGEEAEIQGKLQQFEASYGQPALIVTSACLSSDASDEEMDVYADSLMNTAGIQNGSIFVVDTNWGPWIVGEGEAMRYFTDDAITQIMDTHNGGVWPLMQNRDFYGAFERYTGSISDLYAQGVQQNQYNYNTVTGEIDPAYPEGKKPFLKLWQIIVSLLGSAGIAIAPVKRVQSQYAMEAEKRLAEGVSKAYRATANYSYAAAPAAVLMDKQIKRTFIPRAQAPDLMKNSGGGPSFGGGQSTMRPSQGGGNHTGGGGGHRF